MRITLALLLLAPALATASTYYIDCTSGNDSNAGTSTDTAWKTIGRPNTNTYLPGDEIRLKRGTTCIGPGFKAQGSGSSTSPITLADYGSQTDPAPKIIGYGAHEAAVLLQNVQWWTVKNLHLTQEGQQPQAIRGGKDEDSRSDEYMRAVVHVLGLGAPNVQNCGGCAVAHIRLENLSVHDGSWNGIYVSGGYYQLDTGVFGFADDVVIEGVESYRNHKSGIDFTCTYYKTEIYTTTNVKVLNSHVHDNGGDGIVMGPVRYGLIDGNECARNGKFRNARLGAWTWDSRDVTIQFNESHHNMTPLNNKDARDGGGFDLDLGTVNGRLQYNWSHDNEGEGFLIMTWPIGYGYSRGVNRDPHMRYNVGERDGGKLAGGITIFGGVQRGFIYNNTIYYDAARPASSDMFEGEGGAITASTWGKAGKPDVKVYNNIFIVKKADSGAGTMARLMSGTFTFDYNLWWRVNAQNQDVGARFNLSGKINDWAGWRRKGFDLYGYYQNPLVGVGSPDVWPCAYIPANPIVENGKDVTEAGVPAGPQDFFGNSNQTPGGKYYIGAVAYNGACYQPQRRLN